MIKQITVNPLNEGLFSTDFSRGFNCGARRQFHADVEAIAKANASKENEWIPVSERLPEVDVEVITTTDWSDVLIAWLNKDGAWETEEFILTNDEILAWMPLPEPYRKDGEK